MPSERWKILIEIYLKVNLHKASAIRWLTAISFTKKSKGYKWVPAGVKVDIVFGGKN